MVLNFKWLPLHLVWRTPWLHAYFAEVISPDNLILSPRMEEKENIFLESFSRRLTLPLISAAMVQIERIVSGAPDANVISLGTGVNGSEYGMLGIHRVNTSGSLGSCLELWLIGFKFHGWLRGTKYWWGKKDGLWFMQVHDNLYQMNREWHFIQWGLGYAGETQSRQYSDLLVRLSTVSFLHRESYEDFLP